MTEDLEDNSYYGFTKFAIVCLTIAFLATTYGFHQLQQNDQSGSKVVLRLSEPCGTPDVPCPRSVAHKVGQPAS